MVAKNHLPPISLTISTLTSKISMRSLWDHLKAVFDCHHQGGEDEAVCILTLNTLHCEFMSEGPHVTT